MNSLSLAILHIYSLNGLGNGLQDILSRSQGLDVHSGHISSDDLAQSTIGCRNERLLDKADMVFLLSAAGRCHEVHSVIRYIAERKKGLPIIIISQDGDPGEIVGYLRAGAADFISPPFKAADILPRIWRQTDHIKTQSTLLHRLKTRIGLRQLIGDNAAFRAIVDCLPTIAKSDVCVRISGETGTGKEVCARAIHYLGPRAERPFLPVNCGAIPEDLVENELFGHVRGAFTGANLSHGGLIFEANGGTILLDEIDCLPPAAQTKLLRFVQEKEYRPLGSAKVKRADVRIIAATNADLEHAVRTGAFRQDLFYRLNIVYLSIPPLRARRDDIPLLARHFLAQSAAEEGKNIVDFSSEAMSILCAYDWPGNVRELENVVKRAVIFEKGDKVQEDLLSLPRRDPSVPPASFKEEKAKVVAEFEKDYMHGLLRAHGGNITLAARAARKNRRAFWELMKKYQIDVNLFKPVSKGPRT